MRLREQELPADVRPTAPSGPEGPPAEQRRDAGLTLLAAADAAIQRALSTNSAQFLAQNRQSGGQ